MPGLLPERFASLKIGMYVAGREWGERKVERTAKGGVQVRGMGVQKREGGGAPSGVWCQPPHRRLIQKTFVGSAI